MKKKFDLDREMDTLGSWSAHGGIWKTFKGDTGVKSPDCTAEKPCLRTGWYTYGAGKSSYEYKSYSVSDSGGVVTQNLRDPFYARLIAEAPNLLRFVKKIADGDALALSVVEDARALLKELRQPVNIPVYHDATGGPYDPDDYGTQW